MFEILVVALATFVGGVTQSVAGFGAGIVAMMVLPYLFPITTAATITGLCAIPLGVSVFWQYRRHIMKEQIFLPCICYMILSAICIRVGAQLDLRIIQLFFGIFLICLAAFFVFFSKRIKMKATPTSAIVCGSISGASGGFFSIGGPMMGIYYLATTDDIPAYLGTINLVFGIIEIFNFTFRCTQGYVTLNLIPTMIAGVVAVLLGVAVGSRFVHKVNSAQLRKCIYALTALSGVITMVKALT